GKAKHVGVANFTTTMLDEAWAVTSEPLVCNQIEMHPFINQDKVLAACKKHGMAVVAYCPIARGKVPGADVLERIGKAHGKSAAQVSLRYLVQMGVCSIPRTATPDHLKQNIEVFDFKLSDAEMAELKKLNANNMRVVNPPHAPNRHYLGVCHPAARTEMGSAVRGSGVASVVFCLLAALPAKAEDDKPDPRDAAALQACIKANTRRSWAWENCIGTVSEPCIKDEMAMPPSEIMACYERERLVWGSTLNDSFPRLRAKLGDKRIRKMREMQRAWIASRDKSCGFIYDYFEGSMANTMIAACQSRETGRRALFLRGFADDAEGK